MKLLVPLKGSIQNPTFSPDGKAFLFTRWRGGYNIGAADLYVADVRDRERVSLVTVGDLQGATNVNSPGLRSTWIGRGWVVFSTDHGGLQWPAMIRPDGTDFRRLPGSTGTYTGFAPTLSPTGEEFAFERRKTGEAQGQIVVAPVEDARGRGGDTVFMVVSTGDAHNPSWSPNGELLAWQVRDGDDWRIAHHHIERCETRYLTPEGRSFQFPTWHPESDRLLCAGENALYEVGVNGKISVVYATEQPRTSFLGAPSWCPETSAGNNKRRRLMCEGSDRDDPEGGPGTWLEIY